MDNQIFRLKLIEYGQETVGIPYELGSEWTDLSKYPSHLDCSELLEGLYQKVNQELKGNIILPDGSQMQYNSTVKTYNEQIGDLVFLAKSKNPDQVYHVGMVFNSTMILEARAHDPTSSFPTGKVILRERKHWEDYKNFAGYRRHPLLGD